MLSYPEIFDKIMMMIVLSSVESLHRCRQVCRTWNTMIMENIWENPSKRNIIKMRIEKIWGPDISPYPENIFYAKWKGKSRFKKRVFDFRRMHYCYRNQRHS